MHERTTVLAALPQPRHAASAAADVEASHRALHTTDLSIEGARTYVPGIRMGVVVVFRAFSTSSPAPPGRVVARSFACSLKIFYGSSYIIHFRTRRWLLAGAWLCGLSLAFVTWRVGVRTPRRTTVEFEKWPISHSFRGGVAGFSLTP